PYRTRRGARRRRGGGTGDRERRGGRGRRCGGAHYPLRPLQRAARDRPAGGHPMSRSPLSPSAMNSSPPGQTPDRADGARRIPRLEVLPDMETLIRGYEALLVNRARPYAAQQEDGTYRWVFRALDRAALRAHLSGTATLALSSSDERGRCRWVCLDADAPDG